MKKNLLFSIMVALFQAAGFAQDPIAVYVAEHTIKYSSEAAGVVLNPASNFVGSGLQVSGLSNSPRDITFTWIDNSQNEDGYKFQRKKALIYWNFGCETGPDAEYKTTHLEFLPASTETFRMFSYKGSDRSPYQYCTVEMLRPDLTVTDPFFTIPFPAYQGDNIHVSCIVENIGTYIAGASTLQIRFISSRPTIVLKSIPINSLAVGANSGTISAYVKIPSWALGSCRIELLADGDNTILEIPGNNNYYSLPINVHYKDNDDDSDDVKQSYFEILDFEFPSTVTWGETYDITKIKIKNTGDVAGSPEKIYVASGDPDIIDPNSYFCTDCNISNTSASSNISVGETKEFSYNGYAIPTLGEGSRFLQVGVKNHNNVWEWMYTNITVESPFKSAPYNGNYTGIDDIELDNNIEVYPNPTSGIINVNIQDNKESFVIIEIIDCYGRIIKSQNVFNTGKINLNISDQPKGLYYLRIINNEKTNIQKVILE